MWCGTSQHRQRGHHTQAHVGHKGRGDQHAVAKTMHAVARQNGPAAAGARRRVAASVVMRVIMAMVMLVAVVPELGLVEQKEKDQADQQGRKELVRTDLAFKSLRQQVHESRGQERTGRQTEHVLGVTRQHTETQQGRQPNAAHPGQQGGGQNGQQSHSHKARSGASGHPLSRLMQHPWP